MKAIFSWGKKKCERDREERDNFQLLQGQKKKCCIQYLEKLPAQNIGLDSQINFNICKRKNEMGVQIFHLTMPLICRRIQGIFFFFFERSLAYFTICLLPFTIIYAFEAFHFYTPQIISCCFYGIVTESALKLKSLLVFLLFSNHKRQINSFCLILILSEHWVSKHGHKASCIGDALHLEDSVKKSCRSFLIKRRPSEPVSSALVWSHPACSWAWSRTLPGWVMGSPPENTIRLTIYLSCSQIYWI